MASKNDTEVINDLMEMGIHIEYHTMLQKEKGDKKDVTKAEDNEGKNVENQLEKEEIKAYNSYCLLYPNVNYVGLLCISYTFSLRKYPRENSED